MLTADPPFCQEMVVPGGWQVGTQQEAAETQVICQDDGSTGMYYGHGASHSSSLIKDGYIGCRGGSDVPCHICTGHRWYSGRASSMLPQATPQQLGERRIAAVLEQNLSSVETQVS